MSTIVAVIKNGKGCIAADTLTTFGDIRQSHRYDASSDKILEHAGSYMGIVGSAAHHLVIQSVFAQEAKNIQLDSRQAIYHSFLNLHPILKQNYFLNPKDEDDDAYESSRIDALFLNKTGIYGLYALREVFQYRSFWAIGAGAEIALGAMCAMYDRSDDAEEIASVAIEASAELHTSSALPIQKFTMDVEV